MSEWISVEKRKPYQGSEVLVLRDHHIRNKYMIAGYYSGCFYSLGKLIVNVTHWMPLPAPPKN
jgi:uncharacterized protein YbgA (DUF1722 family)